LSDADPLGWYSPPSTGTIPFTWEGSGYSTSDSQHRADGVLHALCALTRDPALLSVVADHIELQKMDVQRSRGLDSPRGEGRVLLSNCNQFWLGFLDARTFIERTINACYEGAMMRSVPPEAPVKTLGGNETAKYGWNGADGRPIVGWQGWQETIAAIGFLAAHRMTGNQRARELALDISRTCVTECFYRWSGGGDPTQWWHVYATRWRSEAPGQAMPPGAFYPVQPNFDIWTDGAADYWTECSARIFLLLASPSEPAYAKALELAAAQPNGWQQARWWAVR
jgi:hypothetical protein